jgi:hypothetical protein
LSLSHRVCIIQDLEIAARRLFKISRPQELKISVLIPSLADSKTELDPKLWDDVKSRVTAAWIEYPEEEISEDDETDNS